MIEVEDAALRAFLARDVGALAAAGGLPHGLPLDEVASALGADPTAFGRFFLGEPARETFWCPAVGVSGFDDTIKIWFRDGIVVKLEGEWPELAPATAADALGPADLLLDHRTATQMVPGGQHVWPSKGIALTVNRAGTLIVALSTFPPTTPDGYQESVKPVDEFRESPAPRT